MEGDFLTEIGQGIAYLGEPIYWIAVLAAVFVAAVSGIIPGVGGVIIMALSIPFIVDVFRGEQRAIGLVALATMTGVNNTLDSIPAVLLGLPGGATQVTFLEGHQLARQGRAAHTLGAIYAVSALGGLVGAIVLAALVPIIKPVILLFGFPEIAAMAFFGIAMVSALSAGAMVKGLMAGALGVVFGTVGINAITGDVRFVFQQPQLWGGLPIIAVTLGFFALPELIDLTIARRPVAPPDAVISTREVMRGARDGLKRWPIMIRQSVFGVILGAIPGVGAAVIDWLSYAFGIFWSRDKSQFGKGSLDGVLFAESAQNSKEAGQAIPTLSLGVPGGLAWAFVLVAMIAMDLTPGPRLLGDQADVVILLVLTLAIGNFIITMLGIAATGQFVKLTRIPYPVIAGVVMPVVILGGVITMTSWLAIPIVLVFAGIGLIMKLFQWPRPPLLLGVILGPIIEKNFLSALSVVPAVSVPGLGESAVLGIFARPLTIALLVIAVVTALVFARSAQGQARITAVASAAPDAHPPVAGGSGTEPASVSLMSALFSLRNIPLLLIASGAAAFFIGSLGFRVIESWLFARSMAVLIIALAALQLFFHLRERTGRQVQIMDLGMHSLVLPGAKQASFLIVVCFLLFLIVTGTVGLRWGAIAFAGYIPFTLMARGGVKAPVAIGAGAAVGVVLAALMATGGFAAIANIVLPGDIETVGIGVVESIVAASAVAVALTIGLMVDAQVTATLRKPWPVIVVSATFAAIVLIMAFAGWPDDRSGWSGTIAGWAARIIPGVAVMLLLIPKKLREMEAPEHLHWLFAWRVFAPVITMSFVFLFEFVLTDNVLFIIWPEAALVDWLGVKVFTPLFG